MSTENGNGRNWKSWIMNVLLTLVLSMGGWLFTSIDQRQSEIAKQIVSDYQIHQTADSQQDQRIAVLENENRNLKEIMLRLENKVDQLLKRR